MIADWLSAILPNQMEGNKDYSGAIMVLILILLVQLGAEIAPVSGALDVPPRQWLAPPLRQFEGRSGPLGPRLPWPDLDLLKCNKIDAPAMPSVECVV
jgi:hypothetical protein